MKLHDISSKCNPSDTPSRKLTFLDCMLIKKAWNMIQEKFGPHSGDWMSLDSNVMKDEFKKVQGQGTYFSTSYICRLPNLYGGFSCYPVDMAVYCWVEKVIKMFCWYRRNKILLHIPKVLYRTLKHQDFYFKCYYSIDLDNKKFAKK